MRLKDDNGYVLAATLGAIMLVTAIALASYSLSQQALEQASSNAKASRAYQIANSALEYETSRYENDGDISSQDGKQLRSGGTYDLITETSGSSVTITCRATVPPETETVSVTYTVLDF